MFTNKTIWQQLFNIGLIVTMLIGLIIIYFNVITLISGPEYRDSYDDYKGWSCGINTDSSTARGDILTEEQCTTNYDLYIQNQKAHSVSSSWESIINSVAVILFPGIFLYVTNKYERRSSKIGILILDIILLTMMIVGFVMMSVELNEYLFDATNNLRGLLTSIFRNFGMVLFPGIIYYSLIRKSIKKTQT